MTLVVGYQWAASPKEATVLADGTVTWTGARRIVGTPDRVAIELARELAAATGDRVVGVTVGDPETAGGPAAGAGLACGLDEAVLVPHPQEPDTAEAAWALEAVIRDLADVRLVVIGDCAADSGTRMLGPLLGGLLGWPVLSGVTDARFADDGTLHAVGEAHGTPRRYKVAGPAVLAATLDARTPRQLGLRDILGADAKPSRTRTPDELGIGRVGSVEVTGRGPVDLGHRLGRVITEPDPAGAAATLVAELMARGAL